MQSNIIFLTVTLLLMFCAQYQCPAIIDKLKKVFKKKKDNTRNNEPDNEPGTVTTPSISDPSEEGAVGGGGDQPDFEVTISRDRDNTVVDNARCLVRQLSGSPTTSNCIYPRPNINDPASLAIQTSDNAPSSSNQGAQAAHNGGAAAGSSTGNDRLEALPNGVKRNPMLDVLTNELEKKNKRRRPNQDEEPGAD